MASAEEVCDMIKCPICLEQRSELRKLPTCEHSFCEDCLVTYVERLKNDVEVRDGIPCPFCRTSNPYPEKKEIRAWSKSLSKTGNISVKRNSDAEEIDNKCDACKAFGINTAATQFCSSCFELLCVPCSVGRHSHASLKNHKVCDLNTENKDDKDIIKVKNLRSLRQYRFCQIHPEKELTYRCKEDGSLCCKTCICNRCQNIKELTDDELGKQVKTESEMLKDDIDKLSAFAKRLIDAKVKNENVAIPENIRKTIQEYRTKINNMLDGLEETVVEQAKAIVKNRKLSNDNEIERLNEAITSLGSSSSLIEAATNYGMVSLHYAVLEETQKKFVRDFDVVSDICNSLKTVRLELQIETLLQNFTELGPNDIGKLANVVAKHIPVKFPLYKSRTLLRDYRITKTSTREIKENYKGGSSPTYSYIIFLPNNRGFLVDTFNKYCSLISETYDIVSSIKIDAQRSCYMKDGTVAVSVPEQNEILFLSVAEELKMIRRMKTKKTPLAIQCLNDGELAVAWENPVAFGIISCDENTTETVYFSTDRQGRKLKSFDYMAVDEERKHVIQPCTVDKAVYCFDYDGSPKFTYTNTSLDPRGVALDRDGNIYVCSYDTPAIHIVSPLGIAIRIFREECPVKPFSIAFKPNGQEFAVTRRGTTAEDRLVNFFKLRQL